MNKQIDIYSLDTSAFYTDGEKQYERAIHICLNLITALKEEQKIINDYLDLINKESDIDVHSCYIQMIEKMYYHYKKYDYSIRNSLKHMDCSVFGQPMVTDIIGNYLKTYDFFDKKFKIFFKNNKQNDISRKEIKIASNDLSSRIADIPELVKCLQKEKKYLKEMLLEEFELFQGIRQLDVSHLNDKNVISVFDSVLTRTLKLQPNNLYDDLIIVKTFYYKVFQDIVLNGFMYGDIKYRCLTASAGQIRTKKTVFIKEELWNKYEKTLMCGLTQDKINELGGINTNKYLAYLALCNSATDSFDNFDIDRSIVVPDMETVVSGVVDYIDDKTYKIERKLMDIEINHTDGCGMMLPSVSRRNFMVRLPWVKGLLSSFDFVKFIREQQELYPNRNIGIVKDIYGKEHDIIKEKINIIFTKSQFKMHKYYKDYDEYKYYYKKYNCSAGKCNEEETDIKFAKLNYQMVQTLVDITDDELKAISKSTNDKLSNLTSDRETMLKIFGATKQNKNKNYFQKCLEIYPELLQDEYTKDTLRAIKKSLEKEAWSAKLDINGKYTFIVPDLYAFCEFLFLGNLSPDGLLKDHETYCKLFPTSPKLDCLRSPHLYKEHAVRNNIIDNQKSKWFKTKALYVSCHDLISKIIMNDFDGDTSLVCADETVIKVAERNMKDIVPLYYDMKKAEPSPISNEAVYKGMIAAYSGGNIGVISNDITKIWNSDKPNLDAIKLLCAESNFTIDYAKTLYKPTRPPEADKLIKQFTKNKLPSFFIYAKDKTSTQVAPINNSCVNRLQKIIPKRKFKYNAKNLGKFNYRNLMSNKKTQIDSKAQYVIDTYLDLVKNVKLVLNNDNDNSNYNYIYRKIREQLLSICDDENYITDVLVKYLFNVKHTTRKTVFWNCFGHVVYNNLLNNIDSRTALCVVCGKRFKKANNKQKYCLNCKK